MYYHTQKIRFTLDFYLFIYYCYYYNYYDQIPLLINKFYTKHNELTRNMLISLSNTVLTRLI